MNDNKMHDYKSLLDNLKVGVIIHGRDSEVTYANEAALQMMDMTWAEITGQTISSVDWHLVDKYQRPLPPNLYPIAIAMEQKKPKENYTIGVMNKGHLVTWVMCNAHPQYNGVGELVQIVVTFYDVTDKYEPVPFKKIVDLASDVIVVTQAERAEQGHQIVYVNKAFTKLTGYSEAEALGQSPNMLQGELTCTDTRHRIATALDQEEEIRERIYNYSKSGQGYWLDMNIVPLYNSGHELLYFAAIERDITEQQEKEDILSEQAYIDELTGLLNRRAFTQQAHIQICSLSKQGFPIAVAMIDADHFKKINDNFGHDIGDKALCELAKIMQSCFRKTDLLGRFGGEEFILLIGGCDNATVLKKMNMFREQVALNDIEISPASKITMTVSVGVGFVEAAEPNLEKLVKSADEALYRAKHSGRNKVVSNLSAD